jgi:hypothetical protein
VSCSGDIFKCPVALQANGVTACAVVGAGMAVGDALGSSAATDAGAHAAVVGMGLGVSPHAAIKAPATTNTATVRICRELIS